MNLVRSEIKLKANPQRVIARYFQAGDIERKERIISRILKLSDDEVENQLKIVFARFEKRHKYFREILIDNFNETEKSIKSKITSDEKVKILIGSYFTSEYSIQSAALFNPSIVQHFDMTGTGENELRFILSLRATGEGHISSIEFREGKISAAGDIALANEPEYAVTGRKELPAEYSDIDNSTDTNYTAAFPADSKLSERVLFPTSSSESMGMEDARFVKFNDNGNSVYYATYTAYNGRQIQTQLIRTNDFLNFEISTLEGKAVQGKGFALFPGKINGKYCITSRQDGENMFIMFSDNIHTWEDSGIICIPVEPWEFIQLGNCGSPLETDEGWLLLTHAVGPMRRYVISAVMLDISNPSKVIGRLKTPLLEPEEDEREGYVPNVVYSCGSIIYNNNLIIPYAMADSACGFAHVKVNELINEMI